MKKKLWIFPVLAMIVSATAVYGAPPNIPPFLSSEYHFAGYTEQKTSGDAAGYAGMNSICQAEFGENARMCTTKEWFNTHGTHQPLQPPDRAAWVQPELAAMVYRNDTQAVQIMDWTGIKTSTTLGSTYVSQASCSQWTSENPLQGGIMVSNEPITNRDIVRHQTCVVKLQVTCCTPPQMPPDF